jgi:hypothetical protein
MIRQIREKKQNKILSLLENSVCLGKICIRLFSHWAKMQTCLNCKKDCWVCYDNIISTEEFGILA